MTKKLKIRDLTLRDGQQSAFATRMNQSQIDRVLPYYKDANFYAMEVWGGAVPDSVMRYLGENPWHRLEKIKAVVGDVSKLTALSRGRNLYGYAPYPDSVIDGFFKNAVASGLGIMRIFDALNDINNIKSSVECIKKYGGMADCAVCYTIDPKYDDEAEAAKHEKVFTDQYFLGKAKEMEALGADMITIKDMSGLIPPTRVAQMVSLFKQNLSIPVDFHTHCTPGFGLGSVLSAIVNGVDVVDTNIWNFSGGPAAPSIEFIYVFCKKLGVELDVNMEAVAKINQELLSIRKELEAFDAVKQIPNPFNPLTDTLPAHIDAEFDNAIEAAKNGNETELLRACHAIEAHFGFPKPNLMVKDAEIPGGMYTNMVAQLKQFNALDILPDAMKLIPSVRLDAGLPPLVTPTSQIVGAQAVASALNIKNGREKYANASNQFVALVKGEYGKTPVPVNPDFRAQITGSPVEVPYDTTTFKHQENPTLAEFGNTPLAKDEKDQLLLDLFPAVASGYLRKQREAEFNAQQAAAPVAQGIHSTSETACNMATLPANGYKVEAPMPGSILEVLVKVGDVVKKGDKIMVLESMKMENDILANVSGTVIRIHANVGSNVQPGAPLVEIAQGDAVAAPQAQAAATSAPVSGYKVEAPMPGSILEIVVKEGDVVKKGDKLLVFESMKMENDLTADVEGKVVRIHVSVGSNVQAGATVIEIAQGDTSAASAPQPAASCAAPAKGYKVEAPMPGSVLQVMVKNGDKVNKGDKLLVFESMKMENDLLADVAGTVANLSVSVGSTIQAGATILEII